jgi:hypothetical protein
MKGGAFASFKLRFVFFKLFVSTILITKEERI